MWTRVSDIDQDGHALVDGSTVPDSERIFAPGEYISSFLKERLWPMPSGVMLERAALPKSYAVHRYLGDAPRKQTKDAAGIEDVLLRRASIAGMPSATLTNHCCAVACIPGSSPMWQVCRCRGRPLSRAEAHRQGSCRLRGRCSAFRCLHGAL